MVWRKDNNWFGPLKIILQEDKNVIWAVLGNRLFRVAPEHARPLSAVEEVQHWKQNDHQDTQVTLGNIRSGNARYADLSNPEVAIPPPVAPTSNQEGSIEQPDQEPGVPNRFDVSQTNSEQECTPTIPDTPELESAQPAPENIPIPDDGDEDLFCEAFKCDSEGQAWRLEVDIDLRDIQMWRQDPQPAELAFLVSASNRLKTEVKLSNLPMPKENC